jgi:hypothetical protein
MRVLFLYTRYPKKRLRAAPYGKPETAKGGKRPKFEYLFAVLPRSGLPGLQESRDLQQNPAGGAAANDVQRLINLVERKFVRNQTVQREPASLVKAD